MPDAHEKRRAGKPQGNITSRRRGHPKLAAARILQNQHERPYRYQRAAYERLRGDGFVKEDKGHQDAEDDAEFVHGIWSALK